MRPQRWTLYPATETEHGLDVEVTDANCVSRNGRWSLGDARLLLIDESMRRERVADLAADDAIDFGGAIVVPPLVAAAD